MTRPLICLSPKSASFGVDGYDAVPESKEASVDHLIAGADQCLYTSKEKDRNRTTGTFFDELKRISASDGSTGEI